MSRPGIICRHLSRPGVVGLPARYVAHDEETGLCVTCGAASHVPTDYCAIEDLGTLRDPSLGLLLLHLEPGEQAQRDAPRAPWNVSPLPSRERAA